MLSSILLCLWLALSLAASVHADDSVSYDLPHFNFELNVIDETDLNDEASLTKFYWRLLDVTERHLARQLESQGLGSLQLVTLDLALKRRSHAAADAQTEFVEFRAEFSSGHAVVDASTVQSVTEAQLEEWTKISFAGNGLWLLRHEMAGDEWLERIYSVSIDFNHAASIPDGKQAGEASISEIEGDPSRKNRDASAIALLVLIACSSLGLSILLLCIVAKVVANQRNAETHSKGGISRGGSTCADDEARSEFSDSPVSRASTRKGGYATQSAVYPAPSSQLSQRAKPSTSPRRRSKSNSPSRRMELLISDLDAITEGDEDAVSLASSLASSVVTFFSPASIASRKSAPGTHSPIAEERKEQAPSPPSPIVEEEKQDASPCNSPGNPVTELTPPPPPPPDMAHSQERETEPTSNVSIRTEDWVLGAVAPQNAHVHPPPEVVREEPVVSSLAFEDGERPPPADHELLRGWGQNASRCSHEDHSGEEKKTLPLDQLV